MSLKVDIDITEVVAENGLNELEASDIAEGLLDKCLEVIKDNWEVVANDELASSRAIYVAGISSHKKTSDEGVVQLAGTLPNWIESGKAAYDMKPILLGGKNTKTSKSGSRYIVIPFRHGSNTSLSENFNSSLPKSVENVAKKLKPQEKLKKQNIPSPYNNPKTKPAFSNIETKQSFGSYTHKSSIYEGIKKVTKQYAAARQSKYSTFRVVSTNSDVNSWIHPGFVAKNLAERALDISNLNELADNFLNNYFK